LQNVNTNSYPDANTDTYPDSRAYSDAMHP